MFHGLIEKRVLGLFQKGTIGFGSLRVNGPRAG